MKPSLSMWANPQPTAYDTAESRKRLVDFAKALTHNTSLAPTAYENMLLDRFISGQLSIDQVLQHLEKPNTQ